MKEFLDKIPANLHYTEYALVQNGRVRAVETLRRNMLGLLGSHAKPLSELIKEYGIFPVLREYSGESHFHKEEVLVRYQVADTVIAYYEYQWKRRPRKISSLEFRQMFTKEELVSIYQKSKEDVNLAILIDDLSAAGEVDLKHSKTIEGLEYLVSVGLLTPERVNFILAETYSELDPIPAGTAIGYLTDS